MRIILALVLLLTFAPAALAQQPAPTFPDASVSSISAGPAKADDCPPLPSPVVTRPSTRDFSPEAGLYGLSSAGLWGSAFWDISTTNRGINTGFFREANGALANSDGTANYKAKLALVGGIQGLSLVTYIAGHRRIAIVINCLGIGTQVFAALHNRHVVNQFLNTPRPATGATFTLRF